MNKYQKIAMIILIIYPIIFLSHYYSKHMKESIPPSTGEVIRDNTQLLLGLLKQFDVNKENKILVIYNKTTLDTCKLGSKANNQFTSFQFELKYQFLPLLVDVAVPSVVNSDNQIKQLVDCGDRGRKTRT